MSAQKKHPLEIYKASGRRLGDTSAAPERAAGVPVRTQPPKAGTAPGASDFEVRLTLTGALVLLFVWIVLMGASYMYGVSRGQDTAQAEAGKTALALGQNIEEASGTVNPEAGSGAAESQPFPYGVLLITYSRYQKERIDEMKAILARDHDITGLTVWRHSDDRTEVFAGEFQRSDDPDLQSLARRLRMIDDYPVGDKRPFGTAVIKRHPFDPELARARNAKN